MCPGRGAGRWMPVSDARIGPSARSSSSTSSSRSGFSVGDAPDTGPRVGSRRAPSASAAAAGARRDERGLVRPVLEQLAPHRPGRVRGERSSRSRGYGPSRANSGQVVRAAEHVDRVDLQHADTGEHACGCAGRRRGRSGAGRRSPARRARSAAPAPPDRRVECHPRDPMGTVGHRLRAAMTPCGDVRAHHAHDRRLGRALALPDRRRPGVRRGRDPRRHGAAGRDGAARRRRVLQREVRRPQPRRHDGHRGRVRDRRRLGRVRVRQAVRSVAARGRGSGAGSASAAGRPSTGSSTATAARRCCSAG